MQITSISTFALFGVIWVLHIFLYICKKLNKFEVVEDDSKMSKPLEMTFQSVMSFSGELSRLGAILTFAYMCEKHPLFTPGEKDHNLDIFWSLCMILLVVSILNVRKSKTSDVLNREQTEEWKGWMQVGFLMYHYFSVHEVYNVIRVFITCYVWMTGFGNFSFFYLKEDYSLVRVLQMLWRLNFLVFFLCMTMGNDYILYYICPLHTFYFFVVYIFMAVLPKYNYTENGIKVKLAIAACIIFLVWDLDMNLFEKVFFFLGNNPVEGAKSGTMWEWYFRTSLDHWSTFLGIIFALNYPATVLWVKKIEEASKKTSCIVKGYVAIVLLLASSLWATYILPMDKPEYNNNNAYFSALVPMLTYIFIRNISPVLRNHYLEPLHSLGKITLETYLLQHHIWLNGNAKTVLVFIPDYPQLNMVVVTLIYVLVSKEAYRLTMSLRGMCLPDNIHKCINNLVGMISCFGLSFIVAKTFVILNLGIIECICIIISIGICMSIFVYYMLKNTETNLNIAENKNKNNWRVVTVYVIFSCFLLLFVIYSIIENSDSQKEIVTKEIKGMGNIWLGIMVVVLSFTMILSRDSYHGLVRFSFLYFDIVEKNDLTWKGIYGSLLGKMNKYHLISESEHDEELESLDKL